jgi:hypothetical protein
MKKGIFVTLGILFTISLLVWGGIRIVRTIDFNFNCANYLKRAADANTVEMAKPNLDKAIKYLEDRNLTSGIVSIFFQNPANDIGYFYQNLKASQAELEKVNPNISQLEESNLLMKLRETLVDEGDSVKITSPAGLSIYPNNVAFFLWAILSLIGVIVFFILAYVEDY